MHRTIHHRILSAPPLVQRILQIFACGLLVLLLGACDNEREVTSDAATAPNAAGGGVGGAQPASSGATEAMETLLMAVRHVDYWHQGNRNVTILSHSEDGYVRDESGNSLPCSAQSWTALISYIKSLSTKPLAIRAAPSDYYNDSYGDIGRWKYLVTVLDQPPRLRLECQGKYVR